MEKVLININKKYISGKICSTCGVYKLLFPKKLLQTTNIAEIFRKILRYYEIISLVVDFAKITTKIS